MKIQLCFIPLLLIIGAAEAIITIVFIGYHGNLGTVFTLVRELGRGASGIVYLVTDAAGNMFALKKAGTGEYDNLSFQNEWGIADKLHNFGLYPDALLKIWGYGDATGDVEGRVLLMEYIDSDNLENLGFEKSFWKNEDAILSIAFELIKSLAHLKAIDVTHRDVKPGNLMFRNPESDPCLVLADFAFAYTRDGPIDHTLECGTQLYRSPELYFVGAHNPIPTPSTDLWSVAALMTIGKLGIENETKWFQECQKFEAAVNANNEDQMDSSDSEILKLKKEFEASGHETKVKELGEEIATVVDTIFTYIKNPSKDYSTILGSFPARIIKNHGIS